MDKSEATKSMFGFTQGDSNSDLPPLSPAQERNLTAIVKLLDEADPFYDSKDTRQFAAKFGEARRQHEQSSDLFPPRDLRLNLLNSIIDAYQKVGTLLLATDMKQYDESPDAMAAGGRIRKVFLKQIIEGTLDDNGQDFLNYLLGR